LTIVLFPNRRETIGEDSVELGGPSGILFLPR
jgi:hypothetical protein